MFYKNKEKKKKKVKVNLLIQLQMYHYLLANVLKIFNSFQFVVVILFPNYILLNS